MSAAKGNGTAPGPPKDHHKGDGKGKDDTIAKVTGALIASGIAYSLYKSFFGKKTVERVGFEHPRSEPFHEQINLEKPESVAEIEAHAKYAAGEIKHKVGEIKGAAEDDGSNLKYAIKGKAEEAGEKGKELKYAIKGKAEEAGEKGKELKYAIKSKAEEAGEKGKELKYAIKGKAEESGEKGKELNYGIQGKAEEAGEKGKELKSAVKGKGQEVKDWTADKDAKAKEGTSEFLRQSGPDKDYYEENKGTKAHNVGSGWFKKAVPQVNKGREEPARVVEDGRRGFVDKVGAEANREKQILKGVAGDAERNLEKAAAAVSSKAGDVGHKIIPERKSKPGDSAWSKPAGAKGGAKKEYGIVRGDTLWSISRRYGVSVEELKVVNSIWDADFIIAGDTLLIPGAPGGR